MCPSRPYLYGRSHIYGHLWVIARLMPVFLLFWPSFCDLGHVQSVSELLSKVNHVATRLCNLETIKKHVVEFWTAYEYYELASKKCADLRTFVIKMSRVKFTRFYKTKTLILLAFLLVFYSYFCLKSTRISLVFSKNWARMKN